MWFMTKKKGSFLYFFKTIKGITKLKKNLLQHDYK